MEKAVPEASGKQLAFTPPHVKEPCLDGALGVASNLKATQSWEWWGMGRLRLTTKPVHLRT